MKITKISVGIDISKDDFHVCMKFRYENDKEKIKGTRTFENSSAGFISFFIWVSARTKEKEKLFFVMEATGVYYEDLAYYLYDNGYKVFVELANKVKHYALSLNTYTKTDKVDSKTIAQIGLERKLRLWEPMAPEYIGLRDLCRERLSLKKELSRAKCQLHAMKHSHSKNDTVLKLKEAQLEFYQESIAKIETEITRLLALNENLNDKVNKIATIKGLRCLSVITIICETNGFGLISNIRQLVSFAGLDIVQNESGGYKGKTKISKRGNVKIRQCLYMPALTATVHNDKIKQLYQRVVEKNPKIKRKGVVAAMRKLLILIFVLWKKNEEYDPNYAWS